MSKASVAVAIIAKDAAKTIGACLSSLTPYVAQVVVCVDENTSDDTAKIAKKHKATMHGGLVVSEWHECPDHGRVKAQNFAKARQASFGYLRTDVDWHMWVDADDVLQNGEKLAPYLAALPSATEGVWLPYHYAKAGPGGPVSTIFDRERIVRASLPWEWKYRVHEILVPIGRETEAVAWVRTDQIVVVHQHEGHDTAGSARRNILLLEIDLEADPNDMRAWFYLGNQYFALQDWEAAVFAYGRATESTNPYQLWQTFIYLSMCYERMGNPQIKDLPPEFQDTVLSNVAKMRVSGMAALLALDVQPVHPEPWYRLASNAMLVGDVGRTEFYTGIADRAPDPPFFVFRNPLDRTYNRNLTLAQAYANDGQTSKAKRALEAAARTIPTPDVLKGIADQGKLENDAQTADAWVRLLTSNGNLPNMIDLIPEDMWKFGRVRDVTIPAIMEKRITGNSRLITQPRIIFFCGRSLEPWAPPSLDTTGIGGSETAVIQIAKQFAQDGWHVDVYNDCDRFEGVYDGVGYWDCKRLAQGETAEVLVSWRNERAIDIPIERRTSLLWCHDLNRGPGAAEFLPKWDRVLGVSAWHAGYLAQVYRLSNTGFVPNGIDPERFQPGVTKIPFRCVYASAPDRGLPNLLRMWPEILRAEPTAELHIAYGWESFDKALQLWPNEAQIRVKEEVLKLLDTTSNVVWRGRLPQNELAQLYQESYCWLYPTQFTEVSCITAMESMIGGCVPVTSAVGALPETVMDAGVVVRGNTYTQAWKEFWISCAKAALLSPEIRVPLARKGIVRAKQLTWTRSYQDHWKPMIEGLLSTSRELVNAFVI